MPSLKEASFYLGGKRCAAPLLRIHGLILEPFFIEGAFMDSTGIVRAWVAGSGDASALSTLKPIKRQTTNKLRFRSLRNCVRASTLHRPCDRDRG